MWQSIVDQRLVGWLARRSMLLLVVSGCFTAFNVGANFAQEAPESTKDLARLRTLIRQLEDNELVRRDEAEAEIIGLGKAALQFLPSVTPQTSGELKVRLQRIRQAMERMASEVFLEASKVTLQGQFTLSEVLQKIQEQTGNQFLLQSEENGAGDLTVKVDWQDLPFWNAVEDLLMQTKMKIVGFATTENQLVLAPGYGSNPVAAFSTGPFRVDVVSVACQQNFGSQIEGQATINLLLSWEPRLEPLFMQVPMSELKGSLLDDSPVSAANPQAAPEVRLNVGGSSAQIEIQMQRPDRQAPKLKSLEGQFVISVPGELHEYRFEKFGGGGRQTQKYGDVSVRLEGSRRNGPVYEMRLFVEFGDAAGALDSFRGWVMSNRAYLLDSQGGRLENVGFQTYAASSNGVGISYLFQINQDPNSYQLIYESPSSITRQTIQFRLEDIPLP